MLAWLAARAAKRSRPGAGQGGEADRWHRHGRSLARAYRSRTDADARARRAHGGCGARALCRCRRAYLLACAGTASAGVRSAWRRSEEHTSELQSLMRTSYAVFCLKKTSIYKKSHYLLSTENTSAHHKSTNI